MKTLGWHTFEEMLMKCWFLGKSVYLFIIFCRGPLKSWSTESRTWVEHQTQIVVWRGKAGLKIGILATMIHFHLIAALGLVINAASHMQGSECCNTILVQGGGRAKDKQPKIFATYIMEPDLVNGHTHYTTQDGSMVIAFNKDHKEWKIQTVARR